MTYRLQLGIRHDEDNSVSGENAFGMIDYGPTFDDALHSLTQLVVDNDGRSLRNIDGGLFKHLPGVEGIYLESWWEGSEEKERIWLIRRLTTFC